jgi:hypothetical protein
MLRTVGADVTKSSQSFSSLPAATFKNKKGQISVTPCVVCCCLFETPYEVSSSKPECFKTRFAQQEIPLAGAKWRIAWLTGNHHAITCSRNDKNKNRSPLLTF